MPNYAVQEFSVTHSFYYPVKVTPSAEVLSTPSHNGSANGWPSLEGYPRRCSPPDSNPANWVALFLGGGTVPCKSLRHKSDTSHVLLALCTCWYRTNLRKPVSIN